MMPKLLKSMIVISCCLIAISLFSQEVEQKEVKEQPIKYLNVGNLVFPKSISKLTFQAKRHAVDVVLSTKKYNLRVGAFPKNINDNFANHYRMQITIQQISKDKYTGVFLLANALNGGEDVEIQKTITKENFLLYFRLAIYELILGKDYVSQYLEDLIRESELRIDAIEAIAAQYRGDGKNNQGANAENDSTKSDINRGSGTQGGEGANADNGAVDAAAAEAAQKALEAAEEARRKKEEAEAKRREEEARLRAEQAWKEAVKKAQTKLTERGKIGVLDTSLDAKELRDSSQILKETKKVNVMRVFGNVFNQAVTSQGIEGVVINTNLSYLGAGAHLTIVEEEVVKPNMYKAVAKIGLPLKSDTYDIPMWRSLSASWLKGDAFWDFNIGGGLEYTSQHFVNLNSLGGGLKLIDGAMLWINGELERSFSFFGREYFTNLTGSYSLLFNPGESSLTLGGYKVDVTIESRFFKKFIFQFGGGYMSMSGTVPSSNLIVDRINLTLVGLYEF